MKTARVSAIVALVLGLLPPLARAQLTLPYKGSVSEAGSAFRVSNTNTVPDVNSYGGFFYAAGPQGRGVFGQSAGEDGIGVKGWASNTGDVNNYGGYFCASGEDGIGVYGWTDSDYGESYGGKFLALSHNGIGVHGTGYMTGIVGCSSCTDYVSCGVRGISETTGVQGLSEVGIGVEGSSNHGVGGEFHSFFGNGVYAWTTTVARSGSVAVQAYAARSSGLNYAVFASTRSADGYAGYFMGGKNYFEGHVGIGTEPVQLYMLAVNGSAAKAGGGSWSNFSDGRLKEIDSDYSLGLSEIVQLSPVRYRYRSKTDLKLPTEKEFVGLVAQQVKTVIPEAVEEDDKGYLMVNNDPIIWAMLNAIKELKAENDILKERLETLEKKMEHVQSGIATTFYAE